MLSPIPDIETFEERSAIAEFDGGMSRLDLVAGTGHSLQVKEAYVDVCKADLSS